ncbi:DnaJ domain-containing protein [Candidatus Sumerlaeota bacterium]|nr:DnaJ domain-containing protein [Candidatus Sumerlaeota bacterium]
MSREDYYSLLGIDRHSPEREVKKAYYALARELHPDRAKSPEEARTNAEKLAMISKAYNTLKDPAKRAEYDGGLAGKGGGAVGKTAIPAGSPPAAPSSAASPSPAAKSAPAPMSAAPASGGGQQAKVSASEIAGARVVTAQKAFVKGMEFYKAADFKKALPFFEAAVNNDPDSEPHYHMKYAICLMRTKGSFTRAVQAAERAVEMDTYNIEFKLGLGEIYETVGITSKALKVYQDVLKWDADNDRAKFRLKQLESAEARKNPSVLAKILPSFFGKK